MKKALLLAGAMAVAGLAWYLLKPYDYVVSFNAPALPGVIYQSVKTWNQTMQNGTIKEQDGFANLTGQFHFSDSVHTYSWNIDRTNDSVSRVRVYASDPEHSLSNKLSIPFSDTNFEKRTRKTLLDFHSMLREHMANFKVQIKGRDTLQATYCACTAVTSTQVGKARGMMQNYGLLSSVLVENGVRLNGRPFIEVTHWDRRADSLRFNFCYPIYRQDSLPAHPLIRYREFPARPSLKALYNGNYITSDRAWYALLDFAERKNIKVRSLPVEVFNNNPNMGGNELQWEASVYLPVINENDK